MDLSSYIKQCYTEIPCLTEYAFPWEITTDLKRIIELLLSNLPPDEFEIKDTIAIHHSAKIEDHVTIKAGSIIGENSIVKSGAYLRGGVYLGKDVSIGANCEIKQSVIFNKSRVAHLNYVGNSILGEDVNLEAGAILANHFNEYKNRRIQVVIDNSVVETNALKFGSLVGDESRIGANSVLNPGSILNKKTTVGRLVHIDQIGEQGL